MCPASCFHLHGHLGLCGRLCGCSWPCCCCCCCCCCWRRCCGCRCCCHDHHHCFGHGLSFLLGDRGHLLPCCLGCGSPGLAAAHARPGRDAAVACPARPAACWTARPACSQRHCRRVQHQARQRRSGRSGPGRTLASRARAREQVQEQACGQRKAQVGESPLTGWPRHGQPAAARWAARCLSWLQTAAS